MKKKIIILGSTGFIGRNLLEYFAKKNDYVVYGTYNKKKPKKIKNVKFFKCNLLKAQKVSKVLNLSWLYDLDVMTRKDGTPVVLEINPRPRSRQKKFFRT